MRSMKRTLVDVREQARQHPALFRDIALVCLADLLVAISFGAITVSSGLPFWLPMLLSVVVYAGASQFAFVGLIASGGNPFAALLAGLLINLRHVPLGFALADVLGERWARRLQGTYLMVDETVAFSMAQRDVHTQRLAYWVGGVCLFLCWNLGTVVGAVFGGYIEDTAVFGLDAAFPAVLLALLMPSLKDAGLLRAALLGGGVAVLSAPFVPAGVPVLIGLVGVLAAWPKSTQSAAGEQAVRQSA